jgi:uncharacterized protein (TIRG00374 family)
MKQRHTILLGLLIGALLLVLALNGVDVRRVEQALARADYGVVLPAALLLVIGLGTRALRWRGLLDDRLPLLHGFNILNISYLFNGALPFRLGELVRLFLVTRLPDPIPASTTLSTVLAERLLDLLAVLGMLGLVLTMLPVPAYITAAGAVLGTGALAGLLILVAMARRPAWAEGVARWVQTRVPLLARWRLESLVARFLDGARPLSTWRGLLRAVFWSAVSWGLSVVAGYILMLAFFPQPTWAATLLFIVMASLAVSVPYVPGAAGSYEAGVVVALSLTGFGEPEGTALAFAIVLHATNLIVYVVMGVIGLLLEGVTLGQAARGARGLSPAANPGTAD